MWKITLEVLCVTAACEPLSVPWLACELLPAHTCVTFYFVSRAHHGPCPKEAVWSSRWTCGLTSVCAGGVPQKWVIESRMMAAPVKPCCYPALKLGTLLILAWWVRKLRP